MPKTFSISRSFAIHEAGKALVATVLRLTRERQGLKPRLERVERISMVPRGRRAPPRPVMPARYRHPMQKCTYMRCRDPYSELEMAYKGC